MRNKRAGWVCDLAPNRSRALLGERQPSHGPTGQRKNTKESVPASGANKRSHSCRADLEKERTYTRHSAAISRKPTSTSRNFAARSSTWTFPINPLPYPKSGSSQSYFMTRICETTSGILEKSETKLLLDMV